MLFGHKIVALCTARIQDEDSHKLIERLNLLLTQQGGRLFIYSTCSDLWNKTPSDMAQSAVFELLPYDIVDAVVIMEEKINDKTVVEGILRRTREKNIPIITVGQAYEDCGNIRFDYEAGFAQVVRHIVREHGVRELHLMAGMPDNSFSDGRIRVFRETLEEEGIPFDQSMVSYGYFWSEPARIATEKLVEEGRVPKGIICCNDAMAIAACSVLRSHGYQVPGDVLVTGFDGIDDIKYSDPPITSCQCRFEDIAEALARSLGGDEKEIPRIRYRIVPYLIRSESCGCGSVERANPCDRLAEISNRMFLYQDDDYSLTELSARIQTSKTLEEASQCMHTHYVMHDLTCLIRKEMIDETRNPLEKLEGDPFGEELYVFYDSRHKEDFTPYDILREEIVPDLDKLLERPYPLIFTVMNFLNIPMGYVCFHYGDTSLINHYKVPQIINLLNNALGSLRNMRYQQYLIRWIEEMYKLDPLTDLYNRNSFYQAFRRLQEKQRKENPGARLTIIFADVDGLKQINDLYGHSEGDVAIRTTAHALLYASPGDALCVRFGGDEMFSVCYEDCDEAEIRRAFHSYLQGRNRDWKKPYEISASLGFYRAEEMEHLDFEALLKYADQEMYQEKRAKKERNRNKS